MKNFLWFLLGFVLVFSLGLKFSRADGCIGQSSCIYVRFEVGSSLGLVSESNSVIVSSTDNCTLTYIQKSTSTATSQTYRCTLSYYYWNPDLFVWTPTSTRLLKVQYMDIESFHSAVQSIGGSDADPNIAYPNGMGDFCGPSVECDDSDSDGLCDVCDDNPNDSTVAGTKYVKGYYVLPDGTTVATISSYSPTNDHYDLITIEKEYNYPDKFPGLVYVVGMASYIDEKKFFSSGGYLDVLKTPHPVYTMKCNSVSSKDQCTNAICEVTEPTQAYDKLENVYRNGDNIIPTTEQKASDTDLMDLDKTCDELKKSCAKQCGSATNIQNFACSENKHMVCQCLSNGKWELAETWNDLGTTINQSEETTNNYYGDGDTSTGGGSSTSVSGSDNDGDGDIDGNDGWTGSYNYVEGQFDYESVASHYSQFATKFPFTLRDTIKSIYSGFTSSGSAPVYSYSVYGKQITIDLSAFNNIAQMIRSFFALGITLSTIILLIYLYVGIDLRGK